jgi:ribosome-binding ATPase YchF (GTP1/OBG family)
MREEEQGMWEDIELVDYGGAFQRLEEAEREIEESKRRAEQAAREKQEAARKLREMGVSEEQLAATGLLAIAGKRAVAENWSNVGLPEILTKALIFRAVSG